MTEPIWNVPTLSKVIDDWGFVQSLPSVVASHNMEPKPGDCVLDMCATSGFEGMRNLTQTVM